MLYSRSLKLSSLLKILFYFLLLWVRFTALSSRSVILSSASSHLLLNLSSLFSIQLLYSLICDFCLVPFYDFYFFLTVFTLSLSFVVLPSSVSIFVTITLNSLSDILFISISFHFFFFSWRFYFVLFWGNILLCFLILHDFLCLFPCIRWNSYFFQSWKSGFL